MNKANNNKIGRPMNLHARLFFLAQTGFAHSGPKILLTFPNRCSKIPGHPALTRGKAEPFRKGANPWLASRLGRFSCVCFSPHSH